MAAQLLGIAGGLRALSKIPACNIEVLGKKERVLAGYSGTAALAHVGIIYQCELVQTAPPALRRKAAGLVANKCVACVGALYMGMCMFMCTYQHGCVYIYTCIYLCVCTCLMLGVLRSGVSG